MNPYDQGSNFSHPSSLDEGVKGGKIMSTKPVNKKDKKKKEEEINEDLPTCKNCTEESDSTIITYKIF